MPATRKSTKSQVKKARLYHLSPRTIKQIDALAGIFGGKEAAIAGCVEATYRAAGEALAKLKVRKIRA
jgi:hypothetical protein